MTTSGTVSATPFETRQILDHAFRRAKVPQQKISGEYIDLAMDLLFMILSGLPRRSVALWTIQKDILPLYEAAIGVPAPMGTVDIFNANLRTATTLTGTATSSTGVAANAFDGTLENACIQTVPGGWIDLALPSPVNSVPVYGIMPAGQPISADSDITVDSNITADTGLVTSVYDSGAPWSGALYLTVSFDGGNTYPQTILTLPNFQAAPGAWQWFDLQGMPDNVTNIRLNAAVNTTLYIRQLAYQVMPEEIPIAKLSRDDYMNLPDKFFQGRPVQYWYDKQIPQPILTLWPAVQFQFSFAQIILTTQRYPQDVGTMSEIIEVPQRWYLPIVCKLASELCLEIPEAQANPVTALQIATQYMTEAWDSESDGGPIRLRPKLTPYTRC